MRRATFALTLSPVVLWTLRATDYVWKARDGLGPGSSVSIATRYVSDGPGIESRWGSIFRARPDRPWVPPRLLYDGVSVSPWPNLLPMSKDRMDSVVGKRGLFMCRIARLFLLQRLKGSMSGNAHDFKNIERDLSSSFLSLHFKASKEIHVIRTETLEEHAPL